MVQEVNMKHKLLMTSLTLVVLSMIGYASPLTQPIAQDNGTYYDDYDDDYLYESDNGYIYDDAYSSVDWDRLNHGKLYYSYYDDEDVFMIVVGRRIYIVPYDYFYYRIWPRHRYHFSYCYYDTFWDWWGAPFYNNIWYRYHRHHYHYGRHRFDRHYDFRHDHYRRPRVVIHKDGWRAPGSRNRANDNQYRRNRVYRNDRVIYRGNDSRVRSDSRTSPSTRRLIRSRSQNSSRIRSNGNRSSSGSSYRSGSTSRRIRSSSGSSRSSSRASSSGKTRSSSGSSSKGHAVKKK